LISVIKPVRRSPARMYKTYSIAKRLSYIAIIAGALSILSGCASREERINRALNEADQARQRNETSEALKILGKAALKNPESASLVEALGHTHLEDNDLQSAIGAYSKAIEIDPGRERLWVNIADLNIRLGEQLAAAQALENYLEGFPEDFLAWKNYATLQEERGDLNAAIKAYLEWNRIRPSAGPALKLGYLFNKMGNPPQARSWISQAAAYVNDPGAKDALAALIELEIDLQQYMPASTWLEQYDSRYGSGSTDPRILKARDTIGKWRQAQQDIAEAAAEIERKRKELEDQALSARLQEEKARREREALIAQQALAAEASANNPDLLDESPTPNNAIGNDAELSSDAVLEEKPPVALVETDDNPATPIVSDVDYLEAARSAVDRADSMEAIDLYWRALGPGSENPVIWYELADVYMEAQNWLDAEACILEAKRRDPRSPIIVSAYLTIVAQTQAPSKAVREAEALVNLFPREPSVSLAYARLLKKANAPRSRISDAYDNFLSEAAPGAEGIEEATTYLGR